MMHLKIYLLLFSSWLSISVQAKMEYFRLDTNLSNQKGVYVLVAKFTISNQGVPPTIDSTKMIVSDSTVEISSYVTQGSLPADFTTFHDTIYLNIKYRRKIKIYYKVNMWKFGKFVYRYNYDSLYLTSDFLSISKRNKAPESEWKIYPNPANDYVQVFNENRGLPRHCNYAIFKANGTLVLHGELPLSGMLDFRDLGAGLYFIRFSDGYEKSENIKLMITK